MQKRPASTVVALLSAFSFFAVAVYAETCVYNGSNRTPIPVDDDGVNPYRLATFVVSAGGGLSLTSDVWIADLDLRAGGKVYLNGHRLTVTSKKHRGEVREAEAAGRVTREGGSIKYLGGLVVFVR